MAGFKRRFLSRTGRFRRVMYRRRGRGYNRRAKGFIKGVVRRMSETKWSNFTSSGTNTAVAGIGFDMSPVFNQGTNKNNRIGNKIRYKYMQLRGTLTAAFTGTPTGATLATVVCRMIIFTMRVNGSGSGGAPIFSDIYDTNSTAIRSSFDVFSSLKNQNLTVIYDKSVILSPSSASVGSTLATVGASATNYKPTWLFKIKRRLVRNVAFRDFNVNSPTDPQDRVWFIVTTDAPGGSTDINLIFNVSNRISFTDV